MKRMGENPNNLISFVDVALIVIVFLVGDDDDIVVAAVIFCDHAFLSYGTFFF